MTEPTPENGYWQASDGHWYPPHLHPGPAPATTSAAPIPKYSKEELRTRNRWWLALLGVVAVTIVVVTIAGMRDRDNTVASPSATTNAVGGSSYLDGDVPADAECHDLPAGCTPRPTLTEARVIEAVVAAIYPGVPDGKAADWAISTCADMREGQPDESLVQGIVIRFAGGNRPDPTERQAAAILVVIRSAGFCE
ncbi:MAG: hypothetical protein KDB26_00665 [Microthrixaceae bacterium]|nr:hypothetical protein [Microthrixaceae bacterium]